MSGSVEPSVNHLESSISRFVRWLDAYGETSYDFQTFYAGRLGRKAKALYYRRRRIGMLAVSPIIFCEAFVPATRRFFHVPQRFPIADAHYAMGFAHRFRVTGDDADYRRAVHFLEVLLTTRCVTETGYGWGYPFDWETVGGTVRQGVPLITSLPYVYEAFSEVYRIDGQERWLETMRLIAEHALHDYAEFETGPGAATCAYGPDPRDQGGVVNASAYRAFLLTKAARDFKDDKYTAPARRNLQFVINCQNPDGSWFYSVHPKGQFIDHFHTCFVLKALGKIEQLDPTDECQTAFQRGLRYYASALFDNDGLPRPFAKAPRLIVYRRELYDYAECINLLNVVTDRFPELDRRGSTVIGDLLGRWQTRDGSFRSRQLWLGWDRVPMHRWAQAQTFRSLCMRLEHRAGRRPPQRNAATHA